MSKGIEEVVREKYAAVAASSPESLGKSMPNGRPMTSSAR